MLLGFKSLRQIEQVGSPIDCVYLVYTIAGNRVLIDSLVIVGIRFAFERLLEAAARGARSAFAALRASRRALAFRRYLIQTTNINTITTIVPTMTPTNM